MNGANPHKNRQVNTSRLTPEQAQFATDCVETILHSHSMNEVMDAWNRALSLGAPVIFAVHEVVGDVMVNVATGRDARFLKEDLYKYFDHAKTAT